MAKKGILIMAMGHPYYGQMAFNLALSLKFSSKLPIALAYTKSAITHITDMGKFDQLIEVPEEYYRNKGMTEYIKAKTYMYDLSPFDETLFLDADLLWFPKRSVDEIFKELEALPIVIQSRGVTIINDNPGRNYWCDLNKYKEAYGTDSYYNLSSEFVYFKKSKENKKFFKDCVRLYNNIRVQHTIFGGGVPDELIFNIAMLENNVVPVMDFYTPIYWEQAERKNMPPSEMYSQYYGYSAGGKLSSETEKKFYNNLSQFYGTHFGVHHFKLKDKMRYLPERTHI